MRALYPPKLPICHYYPSLVVFLKSPSSPSLQNSKNNTSHKHRNIIPLKLETTRVKASSSLMASSTPPSTASSDDHTQTTTKPFSVLFVCLGNICRSPAAEAVFRHLVKKKDLDSKFYIDSAGTINYHEVIADPRMIAASKKRGIDITSTSRPIRASDSRDFDLILAMDMQNREDILEAFGRHREALPADADKKVQLMCSYCKKHVETDVPDPYFGEPEGFEKVLDILEDACQALLETIVAEKIPNVLNSC